MALVARDSDTAGGVIAGGAARTKINGRAVALVGDQVSNHGDAPHSGAVLAISGRQTTVTVEGKAICIAGDQATCGHAVNVGAGSGPVSSNG